MGRQPHSTVSDSDEARTAHLPSGATLIAILTLATLGAILLAVIVALYWREAGDSLAYWIAATRLVHGEAIYAPPAAAFEPFAYHYAPPFAQLLAPVAAVLPAVPYEIGFRVSLILATWDLAGRTALRMLALLAFVPLAYALRVENVEIFMAVALVYGLGRSSWLFSALGLLKVSPGLGIVYLVLRGRWRDAAIAIGFGLAVCIVSYLVAPQLWASWLASIAGRSGIVGNSLIPVPYWIRAATGLGLTVLAGLTGRRSGELLLIVAVTVANPGLSLQGLAVLAAAVPIWRAGPDGRGTKHEPAARRGMAPAWEFAATSVESQRTEN